MLCCAYIQIGICAGIQKQAVEVHKIICMITDNSAEVQKVISELVTPHMLFYIYFEK